MNRKLIALALAIIFILIAVITFQTAPDGAELFVREGCPNCHSFKGHGGGAAPELTSVTERRSDRWIRQQIKNPRSHNPNSGMPSFGHLSRREISALIRYLKS